MNLKKMKYFRVAAEELKLNNSGPSDGWLTEDGLWLVSKTVSDKLRAYLLSQGIEGIPSKNSILFTTLQEHHIILSTTEDKAIWSATVTSQSNGWSQSFIFLKVMPSLIWSDEKPPVFEGTVIINPSKEESDTINDTTVDATDETSQQEIPTPFTAQTSRNTIDTIATDNKNNINDTNNYNNAPLADSLEAVFNLLGMNDNEPMESVDTANPFIITETSQNESTLTMNNPLDNEGFNQYVVSEASSEKTMPVIEFTETEKQVMKQIDEITPSGEHFIEWLKEAILTQKLIINEPQALLHTVDDTIFMITPGIFMRYVMEFPQVQPIAKADKTPVWRYMQKAFEKLRYHKRLDDGYSIWTCAVEGPKSTKKVHGYLFNDPTLLIPDVVYNNPYLKIVTNKNL